MAYCSASIIQSHTPLLVRQAHLWAVPLALWLLLDAHTAVVEPLDRAVCVVACDHLSIGHIVADAIARL